MQRSLELYYFLRLNHFTALIIAVHLDWTLASLSPCFPLNGKETVNKKKPIPGYSRAVVEEVLLVDRSTGGVDGDDRIAHLSGPISHDFGNLVLGFSIAGLER